MELPDLECGAAPGAPGRAGCGGWGEGAGALNLTSLQSGGRFPGPPGRRGHRMKPSLAAAVPPPPPGRPRAPALPDLLS